MNLGWLCKWVGHDYERFFASGIRADLKRVNRKVMICKRCGDRIQEDTIIGEVDLKEGYYCWGSAGPCHGCDNQETCEYRQGRYQPKELSGGYAWAKCPISNFVLKKGFEKYLQGDIIIA